MDYTLTEAAERDIEKIYEYTLDTWGEKQGIKYKKIIEAGIDSMANNPLSTLSKTAEKYRINTRFLRAGKHHIYYTVLPNLIIVLRVLHQQQNPEKYL